MIVCTKTFETPWYELWAAAEKPQPDDSGWSLGDVLVAVAETAAGVPPEGIIINQKIATTFGTGTADELRQLFNISSQPAPKEESVPPLHATVLDRTFSFQPGWRVDRTRGLSGYDLWEDPDNTSATPRGDASPSKAKPQAFVEILSDGSPDDLEHYRPDYALHIRAYVWVPSGGGKCMYHGRIKIYFIRDDTPTEERTVLMFVIPRGVSTCGDSPFAQFYNPTVVDPTQQPDILATEFAVRPPNIAPWSNNSAPSNSMTASSQAGSANGHGQAATTPQAVLPPINSAVPSGLDPIAIGSARTKMANATSNEVRFQLKAALAAPVQGLMFFHETDLYFRRASGIILAEEITRLAADANVDKQLILLIAHRYNFGAAIFGTPLPALVVRAFLLEPPVFPPPPPFVPKPPAASPAYPALTLAGSSLSQAERAILIGGGIWSGLDLLNLRADDLALQVVVDERKTRQLRLQAVGLDIQKGGTVPPPGPIQ